MKEKKEKRKKKKEKEKRKRKKEKRLTKKFGFTRTQQVISDCHWFQYLRIIISGSLLVIFHFADQQELAD